MNSHLVTVEVGVECGADKGMKLNSLTLNKHRFKRLDSEPVQSRCAVEHYGVILDNDLKGVPNALFLAVNGFPCGLDVCCNACFNKALHNKRLEKLKSHFLRKTALINFELRSNNDNRTARIVNTFTEKVLAEASLLTFKHIGKRLERAVVRARYGASAAAVVDEGVNGFLKHSFFVADNDARRAEIKQLFKAVVAVDNAAVEVVEVARCKASAVKLNHGTKIRRNDRNNVKNHPFGAVAGVFEGFNNLKALENFCLFLAGCGFKRFAQLAVKGVNVNFAQQLLDSLGAHSDAEGFIVIVVFLNVLILLFGDDLALFNIGNRAGINNNICGKIENSFKIPRRHIYHESDS